MYNRRILAAGLAASIGALALIGVLLAASGVAYAVPLAGIGGFTLEAEEIRGEGMFIYPGVEETSETDAQPVVVNELQSAEIEGLVLTKEIDASAIPGLDGTARIVISQNDNQTVETSETMLKFSHLGARESAFSGQVVREYNADDPRDSFSLAAPGEPVSGKTVNITGQEPGLVLKNVEIQAHYMAVESISIPDLDMEFHYDEDGSTDDGSDSGEPTDNGSDESGSDDGTQADEQSDDAGDADGEKNHQQS
jgi:hypothetical protein